MQSQSRCFGRIGRVAGDIVLGGYVLGGYVLGRCSYSSLMSCVLAVSSLIEFVARSRCLLFFEFVSV